MPSGGPARSDRPQPGGVWARRSWRAQRCCPDTGFPRPGKRGLGNYGAPYSPVLCTGFDPTWTPSSAPVFCKEPWVGKLC